MSAFLHISDLVNYGWQLYTLSNNRVVVGLLAFKWVDVWWIMEEIFLVKLSNSATNPINIQKAAGHNFLARNGL